MTVTLTAKQHLPKIIDKQRYHQQKRMRIGYLGHFFSKFKWLKSAKNKENVLN